MTNESLAMPASSPVSGFGQMADTAPVARSWPSFGATTIIGAACCVAAALVAVGAQAPWFSISLFTVTANIGGLNSHLDGRYALALAAVGFILGATLAIVPGHRGTRQALASALTLLGLGGVFMVWHQYVQLSNHATSVGQASGLTPFAKYFDVHAGAGWGLWLTGGSFAMFAVAGLVALVLNRNR